MNKAFEAHRVTKDDPDYVYDKAVQFEVWLVAFNGVFAVLTLPLDPCGGQWLGLRRVRR